MGILPVSAWVILQILSGHVFCCCFEQALLFFEIYPPNRTLLSVPHNFYCGFLFIYFVFVAAEHVTHADLEVEGSTL